MKKTPHVGRRHSRDPSLVMVARIVKPPVDGVCRVVFKWKREGV